MTASYVDQTFENWTLPFRRSAMQYNPSRMSDPILCIGDVLWDIFPHGRFLGGAAFNVACHLRALNYPVQFAGCVGDDELGRDTLADMRRRGLSTQLMQSDP